MCISCGSPGATLACISIRRSLAALGLQIGPLRWLCSQGRDRLSPPAACACYAALVRKRIFVREGTAQTCRREQLAGIGRGLVRVGLLPAIVRPSTHSSGRARSPVALAWWWTLGTPGLINLPSIRAFFPYGKCRSDSRNRRRSTGRQSFELSPSSVISSRHNYKYAELDNYCSPAREARIIYSPAKPSSAATSPRSQR